MTRRSAWIGGVVVVGVAVAVCLLAKPDALEAPERPHGPASERTSGDGAPIGDSAVDGNSAVHRDSASDHGRARDASAGRRPRQRRAPPGASGRELTPEERRRDDAGWTPQLWRRRIFAKDAQVEGLATEFATNWGPQKFVRLIQLAGGRPEEIWGPDGTEQGVTTRFHREPKRMARLLEDALAIGGDPLARQSLIFHLAIDLPPDVGRPRLRRFLDRDDPDDAEDALCALAFAGDPDALERFVALAQEPSTALVRHEVHDPWDILELTRGRTREAFRSYRCIEVLTRGPYFHELGNWAEGHYLRFPTAHPGSTPTAAVERLLPAWLDRYPGHPGSDDMAYRMAELRLAQGRRMEALHWASRCATYPDQDMRPAGLRMMISLVELAPPGDPLTAGTIDPAAPDRNREFLTYLQLRRQAVDLGPGVALAQLAEVASAEPHLLLARAYRERWSAPVPRGLDSGTRPLSESDPLRRVEAPDDDPVPSVRPVASVWKDRPDMRPPQECFRPSLHRLRRQLRAWETLAELQRRHSAGEGDAADLLYKQGALHYYERDVLYPVYATHTGNYSGRPTARFTSRVEGDWLQGALSWDLAIERFEALVRAHPSHALADDALYSVALAHVKAADASEIAVQGREARARHVRAGLDAFERLVARYPQSSLARAAGAAGRYWRAPGRKIPTR